MREMTSRNIEELLSEQEKEFVGMLNNLECMSVYEANYIFQKYLKCSEKQVMKILNHLKGKYYLSVTSDSKYLIAGNRAKGINEGQLSREMVAAIWIALMQFEEDKEIFENVKYVNGHPMDGGVLTFLSNNQIYRIHKLSLEDLYKIKMIEERYNKKYRRLNNDKYTSNSFDEITIFLFMEPGRDEYILGKLEEFNVTIPHSIVILSNSDLSEDIAYNKYDMLDVE